VFFCCTLLPLGVFMFIGPILAAGWGIGPFLRTLAVEAGILALLMLLNISATGDLLVNWQFNMPFLVIFGIVFGGPIILGIVILRVKATELNAPANRCRKCGYDLRASPDRCPECGTPVKYDPEQF
jgi:hypothetical protein